MINIYGEVVGINFYGETFTPFLPMNVVCKWWEFIKCCRYAQIYFLVFRVFLFNNFDCYCLFFFKWKINCTITSSFSIHLIWLSAIGIKNSISGWIILDKLFWSCKLYHRFYFEVFAPAPLFLIVHQFVIAYLFIELCIRALIIVLV